MNEAAIRAKSVAVGGRNTQMLTGGRAFTILAILAIFCVQVVAMYVARDPWVDESMLVINLLRENPSMMFQPMAYYEQATPLGHRLFGIAFARLGYSISGVDGAVIALRFLSSIAFLMMTLFVYRTVRIFAGWKEATTAILIASGGYFFYLGTEIKHYCFEAAAAACIVYAVSRLLNEPSKRSEQMLLLGAAFFGAIFSFTILVTITACSIGLGGTFLWKACFQASDMRPSNFPGMLRTYFTSYWQPLAYCGAATLIALIFYEAYDTIITSYNFVAYADVYVSSDAKSAILLLSSMIIELLSPWRPDFAGTYSAAGLTLTSLFLFLLTSIIVLIWRRFPFIALTSIAALTLVCTGKIIGVFPYVWARHLYFLVPLLAIACSLAGWELVTLIKNRLHGRARMIPATVFVLFLALYPAGALKRSLSPVHEAITPLLAEIENGPKNTPVWVYVYAQPAFKLLADPDTPTLGMSENRTSALGWEKAVKMRSGGVTGDAYLRNSAKKLREVSRVWLFFSHDQSGDTLTMKKLVESDGHRCSPRAIITGSSLYFCSRTNSNNALFSHP